MTTFSEMDHPRERDGKWARKLEAAELDERLEAPEPVLPLRVTSYGAPCEDPEVPNASTYLRDRFATDADYVDDAHWIIVERDTDNGERHLVVGPYRGADAANDAMESSLLDGFAQESCFDMYTLSHENAVQVDFSDGEMVLIDQDDADHHGPEHTIDCPACDGDGTVPFGTGRVRCEPCNAGGRIVPPYALLPDYKEGTYSERNAGTACWSCSGLHTHAPAPSCMHPDQHRAADPAAPAVSAIDPRDQHTWTFQNMPRSGVAPACPDCDTIHAGTDVKAVGRFNADGPLGYRADGGPLRATREEAHKDVCAARTKA